jgi:hypothetical protein
MERPPGMTSLSTEFLFKRSIHAWRFLKCIEEDNPVGFSLLMDSCADIVVTHCMWFLASNCLNQYRIQRGTSDTIKALIMAVNCYDILAEVFERLLLQLFPSWGDNQEIAFTSQIPLKSEPVFRCLDVLFRNGYLFSFRPIDRNTVTLQSILNYYATLGNYKSAIAFLSAHPSLTSETNLKMLSMIRPD